MDDGKIVVVLFLFCVLFIVPLFVCIYILFQSYCLKDNIDNINEFVHPDDFNISTSSESINSDTNTIYELLLLQNNENVIIND